MNAANFTLFIRCWYLHIKGNSWNFNVVENLVSFREIAHSSMTFIQSPNIPLILGGPIVVT